MSYQEFLTSKTQLGGNHGFSPILLPDYLFDFQKSLVEWSIMKGRDAIFADCGLGKTPMEFVWAENIVRKTNGNVLICTPLAVAMQMVREAEKFGIEVHLSRDGKAHRGITITNYEKLHLFYASDFVGMVCDESSYYKQAVKNVQAASEGRRDLEDTQADIFGDDVEIMDAPNMLEVESS